jgi:hypothetical protein
MENEKLSADPKIAKKSNNFQSILKVREISTRKSTKPVLIKVKIKENLKKIHEKVNEK